MRSFKYILGLIFIAFGLLVLARCLFVLSTLSVSSFFPAGFLSLMGGLIGLSIFCTIGRYLMNSALDTPPNDMRTTMRLFKRITGRALLSLGWIVFSFVFIFWLLESMNGDALRAFIALAGGSLQLLVFAYTGIRLINNNQPTTPTK